MRIKVNNTVGSPVSYNVPFRKEGPYQLQSVLLTKISAGPGCDPALEIIDAGGDVVFSATLAPAVPLGAGTYQVSFSAVGQTYQHPPTFYTIPIPPNLALETDDVIRITDVAANETMQMLVDLQ